ncbi:MAG: CBS domain-containing protein [Actinomycetota bacterium]
MARAIQSIMSRPVVTAAPTDHMQAAASLMEQWRVGALAVMDAGTLVGMVSERDVVALVASGATLDSIPIGEVMNGDVSPIPSSTVVHEAVALAFERGCRHFSVVDDGELVGVVSLRDLLGASRRIEDVDLIAALSDAAGPQRRKADDPPIHESIEGRLQSILGLTDDESETFLRRMDRLRRSASLDASVVTSVADRPSSATVAALWTRAGRDGSPVATSELGMLAILPELIGAVHRECSGLPPATERPASNVAESILHHLGGSVAPFRVAALDKTLRVIATGTVDGASVAVSAGIAAGLPAGTTLPIALQVFCGPSQLGGEVTARRSRRMIGAAEIDLDAVTDRRLPLLDGILTDLRRAAPGDAHDPPDSTVPGLIAGILDTIGIPVGLGATVLGVGRCVDWIERIRTSQPESATTPASAELV